MDSPAPHHAMSSLALPGIADACFALGHAVWWLTVHWYVPLALALTGWALWEVITRRAAARASRQRCVLRLTPAPYFDPDEERVLRQGLKLLQAANALPWWAPKRSRTVRIRMRSDENHPLSYRLEGPAGAEKFLRTSGFGHAVTICGPDPDARVPVDAREFEVRGEMVLRGNPAAYLREVPLQPDPLQPIVDAISALKTQLGDLVEVCVDLQPAPRLPLRLQRLQMIQRARGVEQRETAAASRWMRRDVAAAADSLRTLAQGRQQQAAPLVVPQVRRIDRDKALGKLADDTALARVQILIRCASDREGRARALLSQVQGGFQVFAHEARLAPRGLRLLAWWWGPDHWPFTTSWQRRWDRGQCRPPRANLARLTELAGLLKPPTRHCTLPLLPAQLPTFEHGNPALLLQGAVVEADGTRRLVATFEEETLFETGVGKAGGGKTERALAQAIAHAHAGGGLLYMDPHRDSWDRAAPYLAHPMLIPRIQLIDLTPGSDVSPVGAWNLLDMSHGRPRHDVAASVIDGLAAGMHWDDASTPRGLTILTACVQALTALNQQLCRDGRSELQATVFHIRALLTDHHFRAKVLAAVHDTLVEEVASWWSTVFPTLSPDAFGIILNPLARLADNPVYLAFLGQPVSHFDLRTAMDTRRVVWICTAGNGPTDRLLSSLIAHELLRAGRSRRNVAPADRVAFRAYLDELITIAGTAPESLAAMFEDLRKFRVRIHGMTQALGRLPQPVRDGLLQNSSSLATTTGIRKVISVLTDEWGNTPSPEQVIALPRYQHYASFTIHGQRVGPLRLHGPHLDDDFAHLQRAAAIPALVTRAHQAAGSRPLHEQATRASTQLARLRAALPEPTPLNLTKGSYRS
ncbi:ATP/GTP-binding protein [Streptomyces kunmingensis]|uniref:ATP/GTP-binding protein n=1 Tax=Streptomyces kunmingensis TaxID=68225 RepID=A0ABU6C5S4_9ACTN|nr:ATP/GTP-binding protein [Streptomyces kunmingensis]MEB3959165.1 ATP/GTP-binding protein [Streptomyces kunmingensis]